MRPLPRLRVVALAIALACLAPAGAQAQDAGSTVALSDEKTESLWAFVEEPVLPRVAPGEKSAIVRDHRNRPKRIEPTIPDTDNPELVLVLRQATLENDEAWVEVRLPMRPNNTTGWVPLDSLGPLRTAPGYVQIDRRRLRANGRKRWSARVGIGIARWPTPAGRFYVRELVKVPRSARRGYGPFAFGTSALSPTLSGGNWGEGVIGLHGTGSPGLIPGRISHGCIRVKNSKILRLRKLIGLGTPIEII